MTEDDLEYALRSSLHAQADRAPLAGDVVARTLAAAREPAAPSRRRREWRTWGFPLLAAGAVGAIVAAVVGLEHSSRHDAAPATHSPSTPVSSSHAPSKAAPVPVVTRTVTTTAQPTSASTSGNLHGIRVEDVTFVGPDHGWALGSARCLVGSGRCTAVLRTTDGHTWTGIPGGLFNVEGVHGCADPCISHLRFATDRIGYAYGPDAVLMTTNGGATWQRQNGLGADALETLDGNVILVRTSNTDNPIFERAPIGTSRWMSVGASALRAATTSQELSLARAGRQAVVITPVRHWDPGFTVVRSADDGSQWQSGSGTCPSSGSARLSVGAIAMAPGGTLFVSCSQYNSSGGVLRGGVLRSTDGGATFDVAAVGASTPSLNLLAAASSRVLVGWDGAHVVRSTDGGDSWSRVSQVSGSVIFVGFENARTGRIVTDDTIYTTHDAGQNWTKVTLP